MIQQFELDQGRQRQEEPPYFAIFSLSMERTDEPSEIVDK